MADFVDYYKLMDGHTNLKENIELSIEDVNSFLDDKLFVAVCGLNDKKDIIETFIHIPRISNYLVEKYITDGKSFSYVDNKLDINEANDLFYNAKTNGFTTIIVLAEDTLKNFETIYRNKDVIDFFVKL